MHRFAVGTIHDAAFNKSQGLLVEAHGGRNVRDREHGCYSAVLLFVERVDFLCHIAPFAENHFNGERSGCASRVVSYCAPDTGSSQFREQDLGWPVSQGGCVLTLRQARFSLRPAEVVELADTPS